jgi:IPT/TIG domain
MPLIRIARGSRKGLFLELPDDVAASAVADKWGQDDTGVTHNPTVFPEIEDPPEEDPQSMTDYFNTIDNPESGGDTDPGGDPPTITSLSPDTAEVGAAALTMTVTGSAFGEDAQILFNEGAETTTFVSETELTTEVQPATAVGPGAVPVKVTSGGQTSAPVDFTFTEPLGRR